MGLSTSWEVEEVADRASLSTGDEGVEVDRAEDEDSEQTEEGERGGSADRGIKSMSSIARSAATG